MRSWARARFEELCGYCRKPIYVGHPMQRITLASISRERRRCLECAEGPVPPGLPADPIVEHQTTKRMVPVRALAGLTGFDWKRKASGDEQPMMKEWVPEAVVKEWVP